MHQKLVRTSGNTLFPWRFITNKVIDYQQNDWNCIGRFTDRLEKLVFSLECCFFISWSLYGTTVNQTCVIVHSTQHIFSSLFGILVANSWIEYFKLFHLTCNFALSVFQKISEGGYLSIKREVTGDCRNKCNTQLYFSHSSYTLIVLIIQMAGPSGRAV
jgi:hypothetical protein